MKSNHGFSALIATAIIGFLVVGALVVGYYLGLNQRPIEPAANSNATAINSYDECVVAGYPVRESYPSQCQTPDGRSFTQSIGNELEKINLIRIDSPRPNGVVMSPLTVTGDARGAWFFEAVFPVTLTDANGAVIASGNATAQGAWTTEDFVPYSATLTLTAPVSGEGILTLSKANPSGLAENDDALVVPVRFAP